MALTCRSWRSCAWTRRRSSSGGTSRAPLKKRSKSPRSCRISAARRSSASATEGPAAFTWSALPGRPDKAAAAARGADTPPPPTLPAPPPPPAGCDALPANDAGGEAAIPRGGFRLGSTDLLEWSRRRSLPPCHPEMRIPDQVASDARRALPQLDRLLDDPAVAALVALYGREQVKVQARRLLAGLRERLAEGPAAPTLPAAPEAPDAPELAAEIAQLPLRLTAELQAALGGAVRRVLNATGVFVHTNLGRAPLPRSVAASLPPLLDAYCDLEIDLATGRRGQRNGRVERLLTGATRAAGGGGGNKKAPRYGE